MLPDKFALTAIGALCVAAAGAGGYVALRQAPNAQPQAAMQAHASTPVNVEPAARATAVEETEGVLEAPQKASPPSRPTMAEPTHSSGQQPTSAASPAKRGAAAGSASVPAPTPAASPTPASKPAPAAEPRVARAETTAPPAPRASMPEPPAPPAAPEPEPVVPPQPLAVQPNDRVEPPPVPEPPQPSYEELVVSADSVIGLQTETALSSERARVEDRVEARVVRDVRVGGRVAIPAGTRVVGSVTLVERGGRLRERARLGIRFHTLAMADGTRVPITTDTIYRYGDAPGNSSAAKIGGGAVAGAILGAILGGGKGAAIGATAGATGGGAAVAAGDRSEAKVPAGAEVTARILSPVSISVER